MKGFFLNGATERHGKIDRRIALVLHFQGGEMSARQIEAWWYLPTFFLFHLEAIINILQMPIVNGQVANLQKLTGK